MIDKAILRINPNAEFVVRGNDLDTCEIEWLNGTTPISKSNIQAQMTNAEFDIAMEDLKFKRNNLLKETDYLALSDNTLSTDMATYRTNLRNLTNGLSTVEDVNNVTWPTKPE